LDHDFLFFFPYIGNVIIPIDEHGSFFTPKKSWSFRHHAPNLDRGQSCSQRAAPAAPPARTAVAGLAGLEAGCITQAGRDITVEKWEKKNG